MTDLATRPAPAPTFMGYSKPQITEAVRAQSTLLDAALAHKDFSARLEAIDRMWTKGRGIDRIALRELLMVRVAGGVVS